jgi:hypothetical protein
VDPTDGVDPSAQDVQADPADDVQDVDYEVVDEEDNK